MARKIRLYQVYDNFDPVESDRFFKSYKEAYTYKKESSIPSDIIEHSIELSKDGIIYALENYPMR